MTPDVSYDYWERAVARREKKINETAGTKQTNTQANKHAKNGLALLWFDLCF